MPLKIYRRKGSQIYNYRGTVAGRRIRGTTGTADKIRAERIAAKRETEQWDSDLNGPASVLTFAKASMIYRTAGKQTKYLAKIEDHFKDTLIKEIKPGTIKQMAIDIYPSASPQTRNRQAITPAQAVINHCAELELCSPIRVKRFEFERKIKAPVMIDWLDTFCAYARPVIKALALQMFATAERINEARRSDWPDYDFHQRTIRVRDTKNKKERVAHMPQRLLVAMANLSRDKPPFHQPESTLRRWWDQDIKKAADAVPDFRRLTFHSCRHGFATTALRVLKLDPKTAATLGGWDDVTLFMDTYAHAIQDATLTDNIFDTESVPQETKSSKNKEL